MKRFSLGFMKSISSSFEVEVSDDGSSTNGSSHYGSYSTTDDHHKAAVCMPLGSVVYSSDPTSKQNISLYESGSSSYDDSTSGTETTTGRDKVSKLPENIRTGYEVKRTRSDEFSACSANSSRSISSSVSQFLSAVDRTVDIVVDSLIPIEDEVDNRIKQPKQEQPKPRPSVLKKALSFRRNLSSRSRSSRSKADSEYESDLSMRPLARKESAVQGSQNRGLFQKKLDSNNEKNVNKQSRCTSAKMLKKSVPATNTNNANDSGKPLSRLSMGIRKDSKQQSKKETKETKSDDYSGSLQSAFGFGSSPKKEEPVHEMTKKKAVKLKRGPSFKWKAQQKNDESRDENDSVIRARSSRRSFRFNKKREEKTKPVVKPKEEESVYDYFKTIFALDYASSSSSEEDTQMRRQFRFRKSRNEKADSRRLLGDEHGKKNKGYNCMSNE